MIIIKVVAQIILHIMYKFQVYRIVGYRESLILLLKLSILFLRVLMVV